MLRAINGFLPDGALINNVANFYRNTKPLTRIDGSALVIGDRWFNPSTGVTGYWNGTYWLTQPISYAGTNIATIAIGNAAGGFAALFNSPSFSYFVHSIRAIRLDSVSGWDVYLRGAGNTQANFATLSSTANEQSVNAAINFVVTDVYVNGAPNFGVYAIPKVSPAPTANFSFLGGGVYVLLSRIL